jgi:hypothetical protein
VIIAYHFHGQEDEVATKLRPLQLQEEMRLTDSGQAAQKMRNSGVRTSYVEAGGIQMEAGRSTDDRLSGDNKLKEEEFPPLVRENFGSHYALGALLLGKGKGSKPQPYRNSHRAWSHTRKSQKY